MQRSSYLHIRKNGKMDIIDHSQSNAAIRLICVHLGLNKNHTGKLKLG